MYRIILLPGNSDYERVIDRLLVDRFRGRYLMRVEASVTGTLPEINGARPDIVLAVVGQDEDPEERMRKLVDYADGTPVIALIGNQAEEFEIQLLQHGAQECLVVCELTSRALARAIRNSVERAKVERKLEQEEEMLRNLLAKLPDRIYFKDLNSRFVRVNQAMAELFKLRRPEDAIGKSDHNFFTAEHALPALRDEQRIIQTGEPIIDKLEKETLPDGRIGWALTSKLPLRNKAGEIVGTFGISHDVTAMKRLEETIDAERKRLQALSEELHAKNLQLEQDLVMAKGIQEALLPGRRFVFSPETEGAAIECCSVYRPAAAVGGDFFTVIPVSKTEVGVLICDIMGHGLRAALGTAIMRGLVEQLKAEAKRPDRFLTALNRGLRAILRNIDEPLLVTACYLIARSDSDEVQVSSAGHPLPLRIDRAKREVNTLGTRRSVHGPALALFDDAKFTMESFRLSEEELVLLFTDGAIEMSAPDGREIGIDRFMAAARKHLDLEPGRMCEKVLEEIQFEAGGAAFEDDVCLLTVARHNGANGAVTSGTVTEVQVAG